MKLAAELTACLREFAATGAELRENGGRLTPWCWRWSASGARPERLEFVRTDFERPERELLESCGVGFAWWCGNKLN